MWCGGVWLAEQSPGSLSPHPAPPTAEVSRRPQWSVGTRSRSRDMHVSVRGDGAREERQEKGSRTICKPLQAPGWVKPGQTEAGQGRAGKWQSLLEFRRKVTGTDSQAS